MGQVSSRNRLREGFEFSFPGHAGIQKVDRKNVRAQERKAPGAFGHDKCAQSRQLHQDFEAGAALRICPVSEEGAGLFTELRV